MPDLNFISESFQRTGLGRDSHVLIFLKCHTAKLKYLSFAQLEVPTPSGRS